MDTMTPDELITRMQWRYATKVFDASKTIPAETWNKIEQSMVLTPSSFGLQPWKFITITDQATKESLLEHSWHQRQVTDCSHMVVLCGKNNMESGEIETWLERICEIRGIERSSLEGYAGMMTGFFSHMDLGEKAAWSRNQVYIALGQLMTTAAVLGVDACPMEGILPSEYDRILGLEGSGFHTCVGCAVGYRSADDKYAELPKVRYGTDQIIEPR